MRQRTSDVSWWKSLWVVMLEQCSTALSEELALKYGRELVQGLRLTAASISLITLGYLLVKVRYLR